MRGAAVYLAAPMEEILLVVAVLRLVVVAGTHRERQLDLGGVQRVCKVHKGVVEKQGGVHHPKR